MRDSIRKKILKKNTAFTLIEILLVTSLIAIMAAFAIPKFDKAQKKNIEQNAVKQLEMFQVAAKSYFVREETYFVDVTNNITLVNEEYDMNFMLLEDAVMSYTGTALYCSILIVSDGMTFASEQSGFSESVCCRSNNCPTLVDCA